MSAHPALVAHSAEFTRSVQTLTDGVFAFVGFAASNVYAIEGADNVAVIDTTESTGAAANILAELRARTSKPITQIFYTHSHRDHISGASVFAEGGTPEVIAWHGFASDIVGAATGPQRAILDRTRKQFGFGLQFPEERVNLGLGPGDRPTEGMGAGHIPPTTLINAPRSTIQLAGRKVELIHCPGETPDHLMIWEASTGLLISGDNYYHAFPNLYPIRGSSYRDFEAWATSLDQILTLDPHILAPGHSQPLTGQETIRERLTDYRDLIRFVIETTTAGLNAGQTPDDIVRHATLPAHLADKPWLQEFYGRLDWSIRAHAAGTIGWFDGNPTNLARLAPADEATRLIALAGGADAVLNAATQSDSPQWTLELCDRLIAAETHAEAAATLKAKTMRVLADLQINATARNYYLVSASDIEASLP